MNYRQLTKVVFGVLVLAVLQLFPTSGRAGEPAQGILPPQAASSLYALNSEWTDVRGQSVHLSDLRGKRRVLVMGYTSCPHSCPIMVNFLQGIESALSPKELQSLGFVIVSLDPEGDTAEALSSYMKKRELSPERWTLLRGTPEDTLELAVLLGIRYRKGDDGQIDHSNSVTVLSESGVIEFQLKSVESGAEALLKAIRNPPVGER